MPTDDEWRSSEHPRRHADGRPVSKRRTSSAVDAQLPEHKVWFFHLARICNHCTYPGCLASCPRNAIYKRPEDGVVLIDQSRCRGYRKCVEGCPYKKVDVSPDHAHQSEKCVGCFPRIEGQRSSGQSDRCAGGNPLHVRVRRQNPAARAGEDK
ncbi:MAG: 4Fe-4S dicluster domain-containing protein [Verrucomicrobiota bacterium]